MAIVLPRSGMTETTPDCARTKTNAPKPWAARVLEEIQKETGKSFILEEALNAVCKQNMEFWTFYSRTGILLRVSHDTPPTPGVNDHIASVTIFPKEVEECQFDLEISTMKNPSSQQSLPKGKIDSLASTFMRAAQIEDAPLGFEISTMKNPASKQSLPKGKIDSLASIFIRAVQKEDAPLTVHEMANAFQANATDELPMPSNIKSPKKEKEEPVVSGAESQLIELTLAVRRTVSHVNVPLTASIIVQDLSAKDSEQSKARQVVIVPSGISCIPGSLIPTNDVQSLKDNAKQISIEIERHIDPSFPKSLVVGIQAPALPVLKSVMSELNKQGIQFAE